MSVVELGVYMSAVVVRETEYSDELVITHIYNSPNGKNGRVHVRQHSFPLVFDGGYERLCDRVADLYASAVRRIWKTVVDGAKNFYLEMRLGESPFRVGLGDDWVLYAEL